MGKVAGRLVQSLVFSRRGPLAAYATPSPGLGFDYGSEHLERQTFTNGSGTIKKQNVDKLRQRVRLTHANFVLRDVRTVTVRKGLGIRAFLQQDSDTFNSFSQHLPGQAGKPWSQDLFNQMS